MYYRYIKQNPAASRCWCEVMWRSFWRRWISRLPVAFSSLDMLIVLYNSYLLFFTCFKKWSSITRALLLFSFSMAFLSPKPLLKPACKDSISFFHFFRYLGRFLSTGHIKVYPGLQLSHSDHPQKNFRFWARGHFLGSPLFFAVLGLCHDRGISTLNFGPISTKLGGTVRAIKKWPRRTTDPVRAGITEKRAFLRSAEKWFLA